MGLFCNPKRMAWGGVLLALSTTALADPHICAEGRFSVTGSPDRAEAICAAADTARQQLGQCNLTLAHPIRIEITSDLPDSCFGQYHCHEDWIELRPLGEYAAFLSDTPESLFAHLTPKTFFDSLLRHELVHAALDAMPCPYESCPASQEFVAYALQIWFLPEADRAPFDVRIAARDGPVKADALNVFTLAFAPEKFAENAYAYLSAQEDPCDLVARVAQGKVVLDVPVR